MDSKGLKVSISGNFFSGNDFSYIDSLPKLKHIAELNYTEPDFVYSEPEDLYADVFA